MTAVGPHPGMWSRVRGWQVTIGVVVVTLVLLAELSTGWLRMSYRFLTADEAFISLTVSGLICGAQPDMKTQDLFIQVGSRVTFHNHTGYWTVPVQISSGDMLEAEVLTESPPIPPGANWSYVFWRSGRYFVKVGSDSPSLEGLGGWISVER